MQGDEFHDIREVAVGSPHVSLAARDLRFDECRQREHREAFDHDGGVLIVGARQKHVASLPGPRARRHELHRDTHRGPELVRLVIPGESDFGERRSDRVHVLSPHQKIDIDGVAAIPVQTNRHPTNHRMGSPCRRQGLMARSSRLPNRLTAEHRVCLLG
ncbi:hypothetical protein EBR56_04640 [bacterium]|nr:hypothetical protein [bacterium]